MSDAFETELFFLIAKYLKTKFPDLSDVFIKECEKKHLFPSRVFAKNPSFQTLDTKVVSGIPDDQLLQLVKHACPKSHFPSLFFHQNEAKFELKTADCLAYGMGSPFQEVPRILPAQRICGHFDKCFCVAVDKTSQILITAADDGILKMWKIPELILIKSFIKIHTKEITEIAIHPANELFASTSYDGKINIFSLTKGILLSTIDLETPVHSLRFSPCGKYLAAVCDGGIIRVFTLDGTKVVPYYQISINKDCAWLSFSPGGHFLAVSADDGRVAILQIQMKQVVLLTGHTEATVDFVQFSNTSPFSLFSLSTKERTLRCWTCNDSLWGKLSNCSSRYNGRKVRLVGSCWNCDDTKIYGISNNLLYVWDSITHKQCNVLSNATYLDHCSCIAANPVYPEIVYVGTAIGNSSIWDTEKGEIISAYTMRETGRINDAVWSYDGKIVYAVDECGGITESRSGVNGTYPTIQMFFIFEPFENTDSKEERIVDADGNPLNPQPKKVSLDDLKLKLALRKIPREIEEAEKEIKTMWTKEGSIPFQESEPKAIDEENEEEEERNDATDDENTQRVIYSFDEIPMSVKEKEEIRRSNSFTANEGRVRTSSIRTRSSAATQDFEEDIMPTRATRGSRRLRTESSESEREDVPQDESYSEDETYRETPKRNRRTIISSSESSFEDDYEFEETPRRKTKTAKKYYYSDSSFEDDEYEEPPAKKKKATTKRKNDSYSESSFEDDYDEQPPAKKKKATTKRKNDSYSESEFEDDYDEQPPAKKRKATTKRKNDSYSESEFEDDYNEQPPAKKRKATTKRKNDSYSESSFEDDYDEQPPTKKKKAAAKRQQEYSSDYGFEDAEEQPPAKKKSNSRLRQEYSQYSTSSEFEDELEEDVQTKRKEKGEEKIQKKIPSYVKKASPKSWAIEEKSNPFAPQIGMEVLYSATSFKRWQKENKKKGKAPHKVCSFLQPCGKGVIEDIKVVSNGFMLDVNFDGTIIVLFYPMPEPESRFLVPYKIANDGSSFKNKDTVFVNYKGRTCEGTIVSYESDDPFECYSVSIKEEKKPVLFSAWDVRKTRKIEVTNVQQAAKKFGINLPIVPEELQLIDDCKNVVVPGGRPISYNMIRNRSLSMWYTTVEMLIEDIKMLGKASKEIYRTDIFDEEFKEVLFSNVRKYFSRLVDSNAVKRMQN